MSPPRKKLPPHVRKKLERKKYETTEIKEQLLKKSTPKTSSIKIDKNVKEHLNNIGRPKQTIFIPDPFQLEATVLIKDYDVIVSAPTGSGKTWIAEKAIESEFSKGHRIWYASPLKALSNSKFLEFGKIFGETNVGLLTGDHKLNTDSSIIVGTTEILRNQLYDAMTQLRDLSFDLVILDEAHYLADKDRGVVWEEIMIYLPTRIRLLLLSATIQNADDIAAWLTYNRQNEVKVIQGGRRPVPLIPLCYQNQRLKLLKTAVSDALAIKKNYVRLAKKTFRAKEQSLEANDLVKSLKHLDLLPAIFFLKSRKDCNDAVKNIKYVVKEDIDRFNGRQLLIDQYLDKYPLLENFHDITKLRKQGVAAHHAGNLPQFKFLVEELMTQGFLNTIFATSTVSAGVNFPARTVVIPQSDRFNGDTFSNLTATELTQMTGRAGRRGRDLIGFALLIPGPYMNLQYMHSLFQASPDPVTSRLSVNFSMVLNLLDAFSYDDLKYILSKSLYAWQRTDIKTEESLTEAARETWRTFCKHLCFLQLYGFVDKDHKLTSAGYTASKLRLDVPLIYYEALKNNALPIDRPAELAALIAGLVDEKEGPGNHIKTDKSKKLVTEIIKFQSVIKPMQNALRDYNFSFPLFRSQRSYAIYEWATHGDFTFASNIFGKDFGDFVRLVLMTVEHLNQLTSLSDEYASLAETAKIAQELLMIPPII
jgi:superfamily II RNA helicase